MASPKVTAPEIIVEPKAVTDEGDRFIEFVKLSSLVGATKNPKQHDLVTLRRSVERFGFVEPSTVDERTGRLVAGHGRTQTLRDLEAAGGDPPKGVKIDDDGDWTIPLSRGWASADDGEAEAYIVASNRLVELGGWDDTLLDDILANTAETPLGLDGIGFEPPADEIPQPRVEQLSPLRWAHVLLTYPVDRHGEVSEVIATLEKHDDVQVRSTVNDTSR